MTDETLIEITDLADVRVDDLVTMGYQGRVFSGVAWAHEEKPNALMVGPRIIRRADGSPVTSLDFVRAVRKVVPKLDLPTETGTIIRATYATGDKLVCVLDHDGEWRIVAPQRLFGRLMNERLFVDWRFAHICVLGPNGELVDWGDDQ